MFNNGDVFKSGLFFLISSEEAFKKKRDHHILVSTPLVWFVRNSLDRVVCLMSVLGDVDYTSTA